VGGHQEQVGLRNYNFICKWLTFENYFSTPVTR
jgi:hypothetical protein